MAGTCTHRQYYAQFVNEETRERVRRMFGVDTLRRSYAKDEHFNDNLTSMKKWDALGGFVWAVRKGEQVAIQRPHTPADILPVDYELLKQAGEGISSSTMVCIYKEAGRQIVEGMVR